MKPIPIDAEVRNADWTKTTPNIPRREVLRTLDFHRIPHAQFLALPSGRAYVRRRRLRVIR